MKRYEFGCWSLVGSMWVHSAAVTGNPAVLQGQLVG